MSPAGCGTWNWYACLVFEQSRFCNLDSRSIFPLMALEPCPSLLLCVLMLGLMLCCPCTAPVSKSWREGGGGGLDHNLPKHNTKLTSSSHWDNICGHRKHTHPIFKFYFITAWIVICRIQIKDFEKIHFNFYEENLWASRNCGQIMILGLNLGPHFKKYIKRKNISCTIFILI